ncbi:MAG: hypothetical protein KDA96_10555 [Planctomycetaceae bacterium]|nr:hypothetical protein [Planctomycetaceae bacterium]
MMFLLFAVEEDDSHGTNRVMGGIVTGLLGFACVCRWGRPITTRVSSGLLCLSLSAVMLPGLLKLMNAMPGTPLPPVRPMIIGLAIIVISALYAVTGYVPEMQSGERNPDESPTSPHDADNAQ